MDNSVESDSGHRASTGELIPAPPPVLILTIVIVAGLLVLLYAARNVLGPYLLGLLIACMLMPIVRWIESRIPKGTWIGRYSRPIAVISSAFLALITIGAVIAMVLKPIVEDVQVLLKNYEGYWTTIKTEQDGFDSVYRDLVPVEWQLWMDTNLNSVGSSIFNGAAGFLSWLVSASGSFATALVAFFAIPLFMIYYLLDEHKTEETLHRQLPTIWATELSSLNKIVDRILGSYTRGVVLESVIVGIITGVGYWIVGVELALPLGIIAFAGEIVPIIGPWVAFAISFPVVLATQPDLAIFALLVFLIVQVVEGWVLAPKIRGASVDFTTAGTLIVIAIGGGLAGAIGIVFALPAAAIIRTLANYAYHRANGLSASAALAMTPTFRAMAAKESANEMVASSEPALGTQ